MSEDKECFFIAPIGDDGSEIRDRTNMLMEYIVRESVAEFNYSVSRADQLDQPGSITNQIIEKTVNSDLVIADLTGHNPNVFYELAVRHATGRPCIQLIHSADGIPFDINDERTIKYGLEVDEAEKAKKEIKGQLESLEDENLDFDNPISRSADMESLRESGDPADQNLAKILEMVQRLDTKIDEIERDNHLIRSTESSKSNNLRKTTISGDSNESIIHIDGSSYTIPDNPSESKIRRLMDRTEISRDELIDILQKSSVEIRDKN